MAGPDKPVLTLRAQTSSSLSFASTTTSYGDGGASDCIVYFWGRRYLDDIWTQFYTRGNPPALSVVAWWNGLLPNTRYYARSQITSSYSSPYSDTIEVGTIPEAPTISVTPGDRSATVTYSIASDSGDFNKTLSYTFDNINWVDVETITDGQAHSGSFTISNLQPRTQYRMNVRLTNSYGGSTANGWFTTTTPYHLYGSVNGDTKDVTKLYGSASTLLTWTVTNISGNTIDYDKFNAKYAETFGLMGNYQPYRLRIDNWGTKRVTLGRKDTEGIVINDTLFQYSGTYTDQGADWGFSTEPTTTTSVTSTPVMGYGTKEVAKLYGSVNGQTKLVYVKESV